jgi:hypothetical protein
MQNDINKRIARRFDLAKLWVLAFSILGSWSCESKLNVQVARKSGAACSSGSLVNGKCQENSPTVTLVASTSSDTVSTAFSVTATFSSEVSGFDASQVSISNAVVSDVTKGATAAVYSFRVSPLSPGGVTVQVKESCCTSNGGQKSSVSNILTKTYSPKVSTSANTAPTLAQMQPISVAKNAASSAISLVVGDAESALACTSKYLSMISSNAGIIASSAVTFGGTAPNCTAVVTPVSNMTGSVTLTFNVVDDQGLSASKSIVATVEGGLVLGSDSYSYNSSFAAEIFAPTTVEIAGGKMFSGSNGSGVFIWNSISTSNNTAPDIVLGQPSLGVPTGVSSGTTYQTGKTFGSISCISVAGSKLILTDSTLNRVLIWNSIPTSNNTAPDVVVGQANMNTSGTGTTASTLNSPICAISDGTKLIVSDLGNNRVLIWNTVPTSDGQPANVVVGQTNFTTGTSGLTASKFNGPRHVYLDNGKLFVSDANNSRVLIFNSIPTSDGASADVVVGAPNFTTNGLGISSSSMSSPRGIKVVGTKLFIADSSWNRILVWNTIPTSNGQAANFVIGQPDFTSSSQNRGGTIPASNSFSQPSGISSNGTILAVADQNNNRVLMFHSIPSSTGASADSVLGQLDFTKVTYTTSSVMKPQAISVCGARIFAADTNRNRVLVWNSVPITMNQPPDLVLGQSDFVSTLQNRGSSTPTASSLNGPYSVHCDGTKLFVSDMLNYRVLIWNALPSVSGQAADVVVGQIDFTSVSAGTSSSTFFMTLGVFSTGTELYVGDYFNHRVLKFNSIPSTNGASANVVIGQANMTSSASSCSAAAVGYPTSILAIGSKLIIADTDRVLIYNVSPTTNGASADVVIGQANATTCSAQTVSATSMGGAIGMGTDGTKLYITDTRGSRILSYNTVPTATGAAADSVFGQSNFTNFYPNGSTTGYTDGVSGTSSVYGPAGVVYKSGKLYQTFPTKCAAQLVEARVPQGIYAYN